MMVTSSPLLDFIVGHFDDPKPNGTRVMAKCSAHDDRKQSLSISLGDDGKVLVCCHAGCEAADIMAKVGLELKDLYPEKPRATPRTNGRVPTAPTVYPYVDADGALLYQVLRTPTEDGKKFSQRKPKPGGGWDYQLGDVERVIYRWPDVRRAIAAGEPILFPEGERDVHRLETLGYAATTASGGAKGWKPAFVPMFAGADVLLFADDDPAGYQRVLEVHDAIAGVASAVEIVRVVGLPKGSDVTDFLDRYGVRAEADLARIVGGEVTSTVDEDGVGLAVVTRDELTRLAAKTTTPPTQPMESSYAHMLGEGEAQDEAQTERPVFPVDVFPLTVRKYVVDGAESINVPTDFIALPLLAAAGGTIGNTVAVALKRDWIERANPWIGLVAPPGSGKSPAMSYAFDPVRAIQHQAVETYQEKMKTWQATVDAAKGEKGNRDPLPDKPVLAHHFTTDVTLEGLVSVLDGNPGITVTHDELSGFVAAMNTYRQGADRQSYLSLWGGVPLKVDRKGSGTTWVPRPCVAVIGGIQPDILSDLGESGGRRDGFIERFLLSEPTPISQKWTTAEVDPMTRVQMIDLFGKLRVKHPARVTAPIHGEAEQGVLFLTPEAKTAFGIWYDQNAAITAESQGITAGFYSKYPGQLARIALILHCLHHPGDATTSVGINSITGAISVIEYFRSHLVGILPRFGGKGSTKSAGLEPRVMRALNDKHQGAWVGRRELYRDLGGNVQAADLAELLDRLVAEGKAENRTVPTGGKPREETRSLSRAYVHMRESTTASTYIPFGDPS